MTARRSPRGTRWSLAALILLGYATVAVFLGAATASAHAVLVGSDPAYGAMVDHAPDRVSITFDEPVTAAPNAVTVTDRDGERVDTGNAETSNGGRTIALRLRSGTPEGTYLLGWSLLSADGHVVAGSIVFGIGVPPDLTVTAAHPDPLIAMLDTVVRLLTAVGYLGIVLAVGIPLAARVIWPEALRTRAITQLIRVGAAAMAIAAFLTFAATPGRLAGAAGWGDAKVWVQSSTSLLGASALVRVVAAIALGWAATAGGVAVRQDGTVRHRAGVGGVDVGREVSLEPTIPRPRGAFGVGGELLSGLSMGATAVRRDMAAVVAGAAVVLGVAVSGHAVTGEYRWAAVISTVLHVLAMAVWVGGVILVGLAWRTARRAEVVARFGPVAGGAVTVLVLSGLVQSWRAVSPVAALWDTSWGRLLLVKLALVVLAVGVALVVRAAATRGVGGFVAARAPSVRRGMIGWRSGWLVRAEIGVQVAVLVVTALLTGVAPARDTYDPAVTLEASVGPLRARVSVDGTHAGRQEFTVRLRDSAGTPVGALGVGGRLERVDGGVGPVEVVFRRVEPVEIGPDYFVSRAVPVTMAGEWRLRLTVVADRTNGYAATVPYRVW
ncbi:copper resistance protein CopC [Nocardia sp. CDC153]|uniref:copper resistance CopC/CopD family protein n=1 Tax=Nocardia sp. CDC153 TaxID=3112167 RepID=UPI002DB65E8A|nr:copper resistance protein CopC [Nocardia sp. CDC153]MEC3955534.1 copper resistance protein CopC [Nocardia sp. CDC153]